MLYLNKIIKNLVYQIFDKNGYFNSSHGRIHLGKLIILHGGLSSFELHNTNSFNNNNNNNNNNLFIFTFQKYFLKN